MASESCVSMFSATVHAGSHHDGFWRLLRLLSWSQRSEHLSLSTGAKALGLRWFPSDMLRRRQCFAFTRAWLIHRIQESR